MKIGCQESDGSNSFLCRGCGYNPDGRDCEVFMCDNQLYPIDDLHIHGLTGIDAEIFIKNLNRELTDREIREVREWAEIDD